VNPWLAASIVIIAYAIFCLVLMCAVCGRMNDRT